MKKIFSAVLCFIMLTIYLPQGQVYAKQQFKKPEFQNGGLMSLDIGGVSYYYIDKDSTSFENTPNNSLIRFDYNSGERETLAIDVADFISDGKTIYYLSGVTYRNQIWKINCDGTSKKLLLTLTSDKIQYISHCNDGVNLVYMTSDGRECSLNVATSAPDVSPEKYDANEQTLYNYWNNNKDEIRPFGKTREPDGALVADVDGDNIPELLVYFAYLGPGGPTLSVYKINNGNIYHDGNITTGSGTGIHQDLRLLLEDNGDLKIINHFLFYPFSDLGMQSVTRLKYVSGETVTEKYAEATHLDNFSYSEGKDNKIDCSQKEAYILFNNFYSNLNKNTVFSSEAEYEYNYDFFRIWRMQKDLRNTITVLLNNEKITFDQPPIIVNDRTLVPLRAIFEAIGATVSWDESTQTVTSKKGNTTITLSIGNHQMHKNEEVIALDVAPQLIGSRTLVPVRAIAESFGCQVDWIDESQTVVITDNEISTPIDVTNTISDALVKEFEDFIFSEASTAEVAPYNVLKKFNCNRDNDSRELLWHFLTDYAGSYMRKVQNFGGFDTWKYIDDNKVKTDSYYWDFIIKEYYNISKEIPKFQKISEYGSGSLEYSDNNYCFSISGRGAAEYKPIIDKIYYLGNDRYYFIYKLKLIDMFGLGESEVIFDDTYYTVMQRKHINNDHFKNLEFWSVLQSDTQQIIEVN